ASGEGPDRHAPDRGRGEEARRRPRGPPASERVRRVARADERGGRRGFRAGGGRPPPTRLARARPIVLPARGGSSHGPAALGPRGVAHHVRSGLRSVSEVLPARPTLDGRALLGGSAGPRRRLLRRVGAPPVGSPARSDDVRILPPGRG